MALQLTMTCAEYDRSRPLIDGTVNGLAETVEWTSGLVRRVQTGYVRNYALGMLFGVVALVAGVFYVWFNRPH